MHEKERSYIRLGSPEVMEKEIKKNAGILSLRFYTFFYSPAGNFGKSFLRQTKSLSVKHRHPPGRLKAFDSLPFLQFNTFLKMVIQILEDRQSKEEAIEKIKALLK